MKIAFDKNGKYVGSTESTEFSKDNISSKITFLDATDVIEINDQVVIKKLKKSPEKITIADMVK